MKSFFTLILIFAFFFNKSFAQVPTTACSGVTAPRITNGIHPTPINGSTPAPVLTQQTVGLPNTEYLVIKKGTCARDNNGNCDTTNGGGDVIIGTDTDGIFNPRQMNRYGITLQAGDTFYIIPFAYNLSQLRQFVNQILTGTITGTPNPCCALLNFDPRTVGFCDSLANAGITNVNDVNDLGDFLTVIESFGRANQLSINSFLYYLQQVNGFASILGSYGCGTVTSDGNILCYGTNPSQKYSYVDDVCLVNISVNTISSLSCANTGSASISISPSSSYSYSWSNGMMSPIVNNLNQGTYYVTITNSSCSYIEQVVIGEIIDYSISVGSNNCGTIATLNINTNPNAYTYLWSNGSVGSTGQNLPSGSNSVTATNNSNGCTIFSSVTLTQVNPATVNTTNEFACTGNGSAAVNITNPSNYSYVWSNGMTGQSIFNLVAGNYVVTISNPGNNCNFTASATVNQAPNYPISEICLVSVDSTDGRNKIIWEKVPNQGIEWYKIYKQNSTTSQFDSIAIIHIDSFSVYKDLNSNPSQQSASYKISAVDSCGFEAVHWNEHTTIHLSANQGVNNNVNLQWNAYLGFSYSNFEIYRSNNGAAYSLIGTVANNSFSFTDLTPPAGTNYYYIAVTKPTPCNPTKSAAVLKSVSNVLDGQGNPVNAVLQNQLENKVNIYPNPTNDFIQVESMENVNISEIKIFDILGKNILSQLNENSTITRVQMPIQSGTYILSIENVKGEKGIFKVVKI